MSELREAIRDKVKGIATDATVHDMPYSERFARYEMHTDALIEIVREALLSDEAVEAFNEAATFGNYYSTHVERLDELRGGLTAALAAAGLTGGQGNE